MSKETIGRFYDALNDVVEYFKKEYDLTNAEAIGAVEILKLDMYDEMEEEDPEERREG